MKKKSIKRIVLFLLITLLIVILGWLYFNKKSKVTNRIPNYAEVIVCFDYVNIRNTILQKYLFNSNKGYNNFLFAEIKKSGMKIPNYFIAFTSKKNIGTLFSSFEIEDTAQFSVFIDSLVTHGEYVKTNRTVQSENGRMILAYNKEKSLFSIAYGFDLKQEFVTKVFGDIFDKTNLLSEKNELLSIIQNNTNHGIIWVAKGKRIKQESILTINLVENEIKLKGNLLLEDNYQFSEENTFTLGREPQFSLFLSGGKSLFTNEIYNSLDAEKFKKLTSFSLDSLIQYSNNIVEFNLYGIENKSDTSIRYVYDDDFNKVEKLEITQSIHPLFELRIPYKNSQLFNYLVTDSCIKPIGGMYVFTPYPFSTVYASPGKGLSLFTSPDLQPLGLKSNIVFDFFADFKQLDSTWIHSLGLKNKLFENRVFQVTVKQQKDTTKINGSISW